MNLLISADASKRVAELIAKNDKKMVALRVSVDGGGCSGFQYQYQLAESINEDDFVLISDDKNVKVIIDAVSQEFLDGCSIEFIQELGSSHFQITNPNASAKCGCGNSFAV
ncbi:MAG: iron-sulfur cluster insertion protein ErpA [Rickettsiales bacterium]|nr:MAG: iron-sulfur cluster insertion protein ErpA [Rickettsiales bacterium]